MRIHVVAVGARMPSWVDHAVAEYAKRLSGRYPLSFSEVQARTRSSKVPAAERIAMEGRAILKALPKNCRVVALERTGLALDTPMLAERLRAWAAAGQDVALMIGGAEGLAAACLARAEEVWSLSPLTLAHPVARVVLAEQLYRASSILANHPYHRGAGA
ncbi:MAG: 23S rRNA (pseudouridine(1915)-N(3))-methyltransferase RlmH [Gammaproteobacteria bacterium]|nr:23S rRNA (pseudouridine(1915)-N(3))-methyltransferase RlmH [Gammaproteobacteria bacterium]